MRRFQFVEHTADVKVIAFGSSREKQFENAALATFSVMTDTSKIKPKVVREIHAKGEDEQSLLYEWLEKLLQLLGSEGFLLHEVQTMHIKDCTLSAKVRGDLVRGGYETHGEVKAVTYNEMKLEKGRIEFVLDI